jgi:hypothetical protein
LRLPSVTVDRVSRILGQLRAAIEARGIRGDEAGAGVPLLGENTE